MAASFTSGAVAGAKRRCLDSTWGPDLASGVCAGAGPGPSPAPAALASGEQEIVTSFSRLVEHTDTPAEWWTVHYAFHVHRAGILVIIDGGTLTATLPFVNTRYDNRLAFAGAPRWELRGSATSPSPVPLDIATHYANKAAAAGGATEDVLPDATAWWLNGHMVCNVVGRTLWNLRGLPALRAMLAAALASCPSLVPQRARLVLNKRDTPMLKVGGTSPFDALFGGAEAGVLAPMWRGVAAFTRPLSLYGGPAFADELIPVPEHWELAARAASYEAPPWASRQSRAVFRGTATGPGASLADNQRLQLAVWGAMHTDIADVGLTALSYRDRVHGGVVTFMDARALAPLIRRVPSLSPAEQASTFKYQVYADGHCGSSRLAWLLLSGSLVLRLASPPGVVAPDMWFTGQLEPGVHYLPVPTVSDLGGAIAWAAAHDAEAQAIAAAGRAFALATFQPEVLAGATARALARAVHPVTWPVP